MAEKGPDMHFQTSSTNLMQRIFQIIRHFNNPHGVYIVEVASYIILSNNLTHCTNISNHYNHNTRFNNLFAKQNKLMFFEIKYKYSGIKICQDLPNLNK